MWGMRKTFIMRILLVRACLFASMCMVRPNPAAAQHPHPDFVSAKSVYAEYGGPSAIYSITYDTRLTRANNGWGLRVGAGFLPSKGVNNISLPVQVNYLAGKSRHFFEAGVGATYFNGEMSDSWFGPSEKGSLVFGTASAGYRYQPLSRGITARIGLTGLVGSFNNNPVAALPHISVGYRF